jgi:hypothetical protein
MGKTRQVGCTCVVIALLGVFAPTQARANHEGKVVQALYILPLVSLGSLISLVGTSVSLADDTPGPPIGWGTSSVVFGVGQTALGFWLWADEDLESPALGVPSMLLGVANITLGIVALTQDTPPPASASASSLWGVVALPGGGLIVSFSGGF